MSTFKKGVVFAKDGKENGLTKIEFTTLVFEEINLKQQEELYLAIAGISEEYELSEFVSHLAVSTDKWFGWNTEEQEKYVSEMNKMSVEEAMNGKCIREPDVQPQQLPEREFTELSVDVARFLEKKKREIQDRHGKTCCGNCASLTKPPMCHQGAANLTTNQ